MKLSVLRNNQIEFDYLTPTLKENDSFEIYIGRSDDCHILLDNHLISRHHGLIVLQDGKWLLEVLSDFGGVTVNGTNVDKQEIRSGDRIVIDDYMINVSDISFFKEELLPVATAETESITDIIDSTKKEDQVIEEEFDQDQTDIIKESINADEPVDDMFSDDEDDLSSSNEDMFDDEVVEAVDDEQANTDFSNDEQPEGEANFGGDEDFDSGDGEGFEAGAEDGFTDDDGGFTDAGDSGEESTRVFSGFAKYELIISGEHAQYDRFALEDNEILIGRDTEKCQIYLNDPEVSTEHARIKKTLISVTLIDLGSSNGTILNGSRINKKELTNGDVFTIGSTKFEVAIASDLMEAEQDYLMPVEEDQEITVEEIIEEEVDFDEMDGKDYDGDFSVQGMEEEPKSFIKKALLPKNRIKTIIVVVIILAVLLMGDEPSSDSEEKIKKAVVKKAFVDPNKPVARVYTKEQKEILQSSYALARQSFKDGNYSEADLEIDKVIGIDSAYKQAIIVKSQITTALSRLEEEKRRQKEEEERKVRITKIKIKLERAREEVKAKQMATAKTLISEILKLDPENIEVPQLKLEIDAYESDLRIKAEAKALKLAERRKMVNQIKPGNLAYSKQHWHEAIVLYEKFITIKGIDEDLISEASSKLKESRANLKNQLSPMLGRARSLKEAQDLKSSYEEYKKILDLNPIMEEALIEMEEIRITLENRSKMVYREALVSESLSLFVEAKEKFKEVQQISPSDSIYYEKATRKLKEYLE